MVEMRLRWEGGPVSHVSVTMSPICSHVTYHGEITQLSFGVPSDDERRGD